MSETRDLSMCPTIAADKLTPAQLVELRKWWDAFGCANTPAAILKMTDELLALRAACWEWIEYFDWLTRDDEPGDKLAAARNEFHGPRVERTRAALALGGSGE